MIGKNELEETLIKDLFACGAIKFGEFRLKLHEENPDAPLSPIYVNLRVPDNGGPLTQDHVERIAELLLCVSVKSGYDLVAGIPKAGEPFAESFATRISAPLLKLGKKQEGGKRRIDSIVVGDFLPGYGQRVLLIDDLITGAHTKHEAAAVCNDVGLRVAGILVFLDRCQGGAEALGEEGIPVYSALSMFSVIGFARDHGIIGIDKWREIKTYILNNS